MGTCWITQEAQLGALWWPRGARWGVGGRELQEGGTVCVCVCVCVYGLPRRLSDKNPPASAGDESSIPTLGRSSGEGNGILLQYRVNSMNRGAWWATVHGVAKSRTWLSNYISISMSIYLSIYLHICISTYSWFTSLCSRNQHSVRKQLYPNKNSWGVRG